VTFGPAVFLASVCFIAYILFGYPLLLAAWSRFAAKPARRAPIQPAISIVIPAYNGERFLAPKLKSVFELHYPPSKMEVIVVSDGSTDRTEDIAREFPAVLLLRQERSGKPAALNLAAAHATGEILVLTDVRQLLERESVAALVENFADAQVGVASGELLIRKGAAQEEADIGLYWRFESWIRDRLSSIDSMFGATGPFYAIRRDLFVPMPNDVLLDDMYLPLAAFFRSYRLVVDRRAIAWDFPTSLETEFRRKVRTLAGNYQLLRYYPGLLGPRNRQWFHFVSYKFGRLMLPWLLITLAISSFTLPGPLLVAAVLAQAAVYLSAALDGWIPQKFPLKRISSPARTFVVMMAATVAGLSVFFVPARSLWKVTSASPGARL
jgi:cellulose synthase/poly-beta-1,6-N-acetylglucosamine synthase-like glycosyltransferase